MPKDKFGPSKLPLRVPPAVIVFTTPQGIPLILTVAILLVIEAIPTYIYTVRKIISLHPYNAKVTSTLNVFQQLF